MDKVFDFINFDNNLTNVNQAKRSTYCTFVEKENKQQQQQQKTHLFLCFSGLLYGCVSGGLGTTEFTNLFG